MALQDFLSMANGSVIVIDRYVDDPVEVEIEKKDQIRGRLGVYKGNKAVKVEEILCQ
ncbi:MAG: flagellar motor switch protein FliM [Syntrophorhabdus sp. PtaU1.Bin002]|nr:MAG: flagellar motor switch protein FliM [Syntrophorhabdus sp. PtaU1.Bin002]